jgi:hypothetical protein
LEEALMQSWFPRGSWLAILILSCLCGCAGATFTEADLGQTKEVGLGSVFTISLSAPGEWRSPRIKGIIVSFLNQHRLQSDGRTRFDFKAETEGITEITIPAQPGWGRDRDFSMRVRVLGSDSPSVYKELRYERDRQRDRD